MSKEQYIEFPEEYTRRELNARYREIPLKDTTSRLLRKYFNAMANLYGIIPLHKAKEIVFSLSPKLVTEDENFLPLRKLPVMSARTTTFWAEMNFTRMSSTQSPLTARSLMSH